ncbi:MAG: Transcriptional regulator, GntR family with LacI sensor [Candidatus Uhrbacteria bacterium GW2011_GWF2_39_13]|uniref:Transcriptional regulator, GntR family with LacI sensor n=1 Tax=Candidatus Uhrbacteria bacterium GW2011_GWF2_39_13 TaxID=1618995 RepID=A0A0G0MKM5_9BACT|nr:MAG: Transcriptional regulator, GntR family with LacI sensor [Candidatus Uhrbacteria bacterium GW2011_GWF2_39_13]
MAVSLKVQFNGDSIKREICSQIRKRILKKGDKIFPEEQLAKQYRLGIRTVRKALFELEEEGIIYRRKRVGTFVNSTLIEKMNIAILIFDIMDSTSAYYREIFKGINSALAPQYHNVQIHPIQSHQIKGERHSLLRNLIYSGEINGLLILSWLDENEIIELAQKSVPFVISGFEYKNIKVPNIIADIEGSLDKIMNYLTNQGHQDIALMAGHLDIPNNNVLMAEEKIRNIHASCMERKNFKSCFLKCGLYTPAAGEKLMDELLEEKRTPSAVIVHGNELTCGALRSLKKHGLHPGKDMLLIGYAEDPSGFPRPVIRNPAYEMGKKSVEMLIRQINENKIEVKKELIEPEFIFI